MTDEERERRRTIAVKAALDKIKNDIWFSPPEARELLLEKIEIRLERMALWLMPDDGEFEELHEGDLKLLESGA